MNDNIQEIASSTLSPFHKQHVLGWQTGVAVEYWSTKVCDTYSQNWQKDEAVQEW
jgi:hypothetical protein